MVLVQFSSVAQSCPTLCDSMKHSMPGLPVHHQILKSTQTHVHWVSDVIQLSHSLSPTSPSALSQSLFQWGSSSHQVAKVLEFQLQHQFQFSSVQSLCCVWFFANPWSTACQASLSITNSWSSLRLTSIESVMPSIHLILCRPLLLLPSIFPSIRVFSNELALRIRWPKYWTFSFNI